MLFRSFVLALVDLSQIGVEIFPASEHVLVWDESEVPQGNELLALLTDQQGRLLPVAAVNDLVVSARGGDLVRKERDHEIHTIYDC